MQRILKKDVIVKQKIFLVLLIVLILTGNVISCKEFRVFGLVLSAYRVVIPCMALYYIFIRICQKNICFLQMNKILFMYIGMLFFWIMWGLGLAVLSSYTDLKRAAQDLLALFLGMCSIYCFWELCGGERDLNLVFRSIRYVCSILSFWGLVEIVSGLYLPYSKYYWFDMIKDKKDIFAIVLHGIKDDCVYPATTIFHNINDFSVFLAIFLPLFYPSKRYNKKKNIVYSLCILSIIFILSVNDSNIAIIASIFSLIVYLIFMVEERKYITLLSGSILFFYVIGNKLLLSLVVFIKSNLPITIPEVAKQYKNLMELIQRSQLYNMTEVVGTQVVDAISGGANSLTCRLQITVTSLKMIIDSKFMGIGPAAFENWININEKDSMLVNPHNWWLEIFSQYGILVFLAYIITMLVIFAKIFGLYKIHKNMGMLFYMCMCSTFCIACIAPSSYLSYTYQWILPAIGITLIENNRNN